MNDQRFTRRDFLGKSSQLAAGAVAATAWYVPTTALGQTARESAMARVQYAIIGTGWRPDIKRQGRGLAIANQANQLNTQLVAICDVDSVAAEYAQAKLSGGKAKTYEDYNDVLARDDVEAVLIATPDHWHTKIAIDAMRAGKDVYCEKPLTLTIDEGKQICKVVKETGRIFQVGTQQRSECNNRFLTAVEMVQQGRIGKVKKVTVGIDQGEVGGPFQSSLPPKHLNWDRWLGQAPLVPYIKERSHWTFRWWYEYSGGKLTDWGAHHVDIAQWAIGMQDRGPTSVGGTVEFQQELRNGYATQNNKYNTAVKFDIRCMFPNDVEMNIHSRNNGILFEGTEGRLFVNRGKLTGKPVDELKSKPLDEDFVLYLCKGKPSGNHMANFMECVDSRDEPISDVFTHHRTLTTCHLANIALRLGRDLKWDDKKEEFIDDPQANSFLKREQRAGYETM